MSKSIPYRLTTPRASEEILAECYASPALFQPWEDLSEVEKGEFTTHGPLPCDGSGVVGVWCGECRFGELQQG